jgi:hypothetical protein
MMNLLRDFIYRQIFVDSFLVKPQMIGEESCNSEEGNGFTFIPFGPEIRIFVECNILERKDEKKLTDSISVA